MKRLLTTAFTAALCDVTYTSPITGRQVHYPESEIAPGTLALATSLKDDDGDLEIILDDGRVEWIHPESHWRMVGERGGGLLRPKLFVRAGLGHDSDRVVISRVRTGYWDPSTLRQYANALERHADRIATADRRYCVGCDRTRPLAEFGVNGRNVDALMHECKACVNGAARSSYRGKRSS